MLTYILIRNKVRDFAAWKKIYDDNLPLRSGAGLRELSLFRGEGDPNDVTILFETADIDRAKKFAASDELKAAMQMAGVIGKPVISFLHEERTAVHSKAA